MDMRTIGAKEQYFGFIVQVHQALFDTRALSRDQKIQNGLRHDKGQSLVSFLTKTKAPPLRQRISRSTTWGWRPVCTIQGQNGYTSALGR